MTPDPLATIREAHKVVRHPTYHGFESWCDKDHVIQPCDVQILLDWIDRDAGVRLGDEDAERHAFAEGLALGMTQLDPTLLVPGLHAWFCGESVRHGDKGRPHIGWACERGAAVIAREYAATPEAR